ncbi:MAG TPA: hypothetical protein VGH33_19190 [Isosphaeraceae bacterium]
MKAHTAGPRRRRWPLVALGIGLAAALVVFVPPAAPVEVNVSPLASVSVAGQVGRVVPGAGIEYCLPEAMLDGTLDTLYLAEIHPADDGLVASITWPWPMELRRLGVLGGDGKFVGTLVVEAGPERMIVRRDPQPGRPFFVERTALAAIDRITIRWLDRPPGMATIRLNTIAAMVVMPRWQAWAYVLGLNVVGPYLAGAFVLLALMGIGRWLAPAGDLGRRMVLGVLGSSVLAVAWIATPRHPWVTAVYIAIMGLAAAMELVRGPMLRTSPERGLLALIAMSAGLLVLYVFADTYLVMNRRMQPVDYLNSYIGGQLLAARAPMVGELLLRPWLLHAFFAPMTAPLGRFGYWGYVGVMSWLNALVLVPIATIARRWGRGDGLRAAGWVALMPILACFNGPGQRPLAAAFCLLAIAAWQERRALFGSLCLTTAVGVHRGSLFLAPPAAIVLFLRAGWQEAARALALPVAAYLAWSRAVPAAHPEVFNVFAFYPVMTSYSVTFPAGTTLLGAARSLPAEYWAQLVANRFRQLRHYLWTDNLSQPVVDTFRWISLISAMGLVWTASLIRPAIWRGRGEFVALAAAGPLLIYHAYIGIANPIFHANPTPFFALALLAVSVPLPAWAENLARVELVARRLLPLAIVVLMPGERGEPGLSRFGLLGDDRASCIALACLAPLAWLGLAWWVVTLPRGESVAPVVKLPTRTAKPPG